MDDGYNGWTNYETWNVALWADNEEGTYRERIRRRLKTPAECEAFVREIWPNGTPDMDGAPDYGCVNWDEIAGHWAADSAEADAAD